MKENRIIGFKSNTDNYYEEESGRKSNTIRKIDMKDGRFIALTEMLNSRSYGKVEIIHKQYPKERFIRRITNITKWMGSYLISWKHPSSNKG